MTTNEKKRLTEDTLVSLLCAMAEQLLSRVENGEATPQDFSNAIKLLNNNGITVAVNKGEPMSLLADMLPFETDSIISV